MAGSHPARSVGRELWLLVQVERGGGWCADVVASGVAPPVPSPPVLFG